MKQSTPTTEVKHTQGEWRRTSNYGGECNILNGDGYIIATHVDSDEADKICQAVNERQALLDSNKELLMNVLTGIDIIKNLLNGEDGKLSPATRSMYENFCINVKQTALNNAKNIKQGLE